MASCLFCSFARLKPGDDGAYTHTLEDVWAKLQARSHQPLTEVHVVNGLHPDLPFSYYTELLRGFKRIRPGIHLKCFTAVEIAFFADLYGKTDEQVLTELNVEALPMEVPASVDFDVSAIHLGESAHLSHSPPAPAPGRTDSLRPW